MHDMEAHTADASAHFRAVTERLLEVTSQLARVQSEVAVLKTSANEVTYKWALEMFAFNVAFYESPTFQAFGHTFHLSFAKQMQGSQYGYYGVYLIMNSRVPDTAGCRFKLGRLNTLDRIHCHRDTIPFMKYGVTGTNWSWGIPTTVHPSLLTSNALLTAMGVNCTFILKLSF